MRFLLDTDHISFLQRRTGSEHLALVSRMARHPRGDFGFSVVSFHEQALGAHTYVSRARTTADVVRGYTLMGEILRGFLAAPIVPFDAPAGTVFDSLRSQRLRIATMDLRIAAIAMSRGLTVLTQCRRLWAGAGAADGGLVGLTGLGKEGSPAQQFGVDLQQRFALRTQQESPMSSKGA